MSKELVVFEYGMKEVRVVHNGEIYFVAKDVCDALGYGNSREAVSKHCKYAKTINFNSVTNRDGIRGNPNVTVIPESDVYRLIMRSNMPDAEKFQDWVCETVLPTLRKDGIYMVGEENKKQFSSDEELILEAMKRLQNKVERLQLENEEQRALIERLQPMAEKYADFMDMKGGWSLDAARRILNVPQRKFFNWLRANGWISKTRKYGRNGNPVGYKNHAMAKALMKGYLDAKLFINPKTKYEGEWTIVTPEGLDFFFSKIKEIKEF